MNKSLLILATLVLITGTQAQDWKPGAGPLITGGAKDGSPTNAHLEYPRPQLVRKGWLHLNGRWDLNKTPPWWCLDIGFSRNLP